MSISITTPNCMVYYVSGVLGPADCPCSADLNQDIDHAVLVVGYGTASDGTQFWAVQNSWAYEWGRQGFFYLQRGVSLTGGSSYSQGMCSILSFPLYPMGVTSQVTSSNSSALAPARWSNILLDPLGTTTACYSNPSGYYTNSACSVGGDMAPSSFPGSGVVQQLAHSVAFVVLAMYSML